MINRPLALVIENDGGTRRLLDVLLSRYGFEVDLVAEPAEALILVQAVDYDAILLDLRARPQAGIAVLSWIRDHRPHALARTIIFSSAPPLHVEELRGRWPEARVIRKPFELQDVTAAAHAVIADRQIRDRDAHGIFARRSVQAGAKAGILVRNDGDRVDLVDAFGYPAEATTVFPLSVNDPYPICESIRQARSVWIGSVVLAVDRYPILSRAFELHQSAALAAVPIQRDATVLGAAGWTFPEPRRFDEAEQHAFASIAATIAASFDAAQSGEHART